MHQNLLTPAEFAKLARTTKRTVLWYAEKGILLPHTTSESGYRLYLPEQIIDFQSILLMRKLGVALEDIKARMAGGNSLQDLFQQQRGAIEVQIGDLQRMLTATTHYYHNLGATGTLVKPRIEQTKPLDIYYIDRQGPYANIKHYADELQGMFVHVPKDAIRLTIFMEDYYQPQTAAMQIGIVCRPDVQPKPGVTVPSQTLPAYKTLSYVHHGSSTLLSLLWQELGKYCRLNHLTHDDSLPFADLEFYRMDDAPYIDNDDSLITTMHMPIC